MKNGLPLDDAYLALLRQIKSVIRSTQIKAALSVNQHLIELYWEIGKMIVREQEAKGWGSAVVERLAVDLKLEFPDMGGFSRPQLFFMRQFFIFYRDADEKVLQLVRQIPWGHNILIFRKIKELEEAVFYAKKTVENNWSRNILDLQIASNLYTRQGKSITNFHSTLPKPQADLANELLKDILCKSKNRIEVEYALRDLNKPIGVSDFLLSHQLPDNLKSSLPTVEQIQEELERRLAETDL